jgi:5'-3' exonuclease
LLGCDYLEPIRGVGPKSALKLIREYKGLAGVVEHLREKFVVYSLAIALCLTSLTQGCRKSRGRRRYEKEERWYLHSGRMALGGGKEGL